MPDHSQPFSLERFLPYRLAVLASSVSRALGDVYGSRFNLTIPEWRVIANLGHAGALYAGELSELSNMDKPKVTRAIQSLEAAGHLLRIVDTDDRRQARLSLTKKGKRLFSNIAELAVEWEVELLRPLDANERKMLTQVLDKLSVQSLNMQAKSKPIRRKQSPKSSG